MFAKFVQQVFMYVKTMHEIQSEILFARGEASQHPVAFTPAGAFVMITTEADNSCAPHFWFFFCNLLHHFENLKTIFTFLLIFNRIEKALYACVINFGF